MMTLGDLLRHTRATAHRIGIEFRKFEPLRDDPNLRIVRLCEAERIDVLVDVGSNTGSWAQTVRESGFGGRIISFEAHPWAAGAARIRAARDPDWNVHSVAVGSVTGTLALSMTEASEWSSVLAPASDSFQPTKAVTTTQVTVKRLDEVLAGIDGRLFLKLDVQGYELEALRGASGIIDRVCAGKAEVLLRSVYVGQPTLIDFVGELESRGLHVVGFEHGYIEETGKERFVDVLFSRTGLADVRPDSDPPDDSTGR
jgi:FkbM family methyltransferase